MFLLREIGKNYVKVQYWFWGIILNFGGSKFVVLCLVLYLNQNVYFFVENIGMFEVGQVFEL